MPPSPAQCEPAWRSPAGLFYSFMMLIKVLCDQDCRLV
jgi:hypothetical protein